MLLQVTCNWVLLVYVFLVTDIFTVSQCMHLAFPITYPSLVQRSFGTNTQSLVTFAVLECNIAEVSVCAMRIYMTLNVSSHHYVRVIAKQYFVVGFDFTLTFKLLSHFAIDSCIYVCSTLQPILISSTQVFYKWDSSPPSLSSRFICNAQMCHFQLLIVN